MRSRRLFEQRTPRVVVIISLLFSCFHPRKSRFWITLSRNCCRQCIVVNRLATDFGLTSTTWRNASPRARDGRPREKRCRVNKDFGDLIPKMRRFYRAFSEIFQRFYYILFHYYFFFFYFTWWITSRSYVGVPRAVSSSYCLDRIISAARYWRTASISIKSR